MWRIKGHFAPDQLSSLLDCDQMSYYEILGVSKEEATSPEALKKAYHRALLRAHPDKKHSEEYEGSLSVEVIRHAYEVLSDEKKRRDYEVKRAKTDAISVSEVVDLEDLDTDETNPMNIRWTRACRCGHDQGYSVSEDDLEANGNAEEIYMQCIGCSIWIKVLYSIEDAN